MNKNFDLVCGMNLDGLAGLSHFTVNGKDFHFCGEGCKTRFQKEPERFQKNPLLKLENIYKVFNSRTKVLNGINLNIWEGDFVAIIGASGSGKSTLLNMMGLLDRPTSGAVYLKGKEISNFKDEERAYLRSLTFGFVFQQYNLIPWLTAYENVYLPLVFAGRSVEKAKLEKDFSDLGLKERLIHRPFELSGGEQQRVAILRALSNNPEIIIGDEPTGNLDSETGNKILDMLINLNKIHRKTLIIVTHDADIAEKANQVIIMKDGEMVRNHQIHKKIYTE